MRVRVCAGLAGVMRAPGYFWRATAYCPPFPMPEVDWATVKYRPIQGVKISREHPQVLQ